MDLTDPLLLLLIAPALALLGWFHLRSTHPMSPSRRRALLVVRTSLVILTILALSGIARQELTEEQAVIFVMDHSQSQGENGQNSAHERAARIIDDLPASSLVGVVSAGASTRLVRSPTREREPLVPPEGLMAKDGSQTDLAGAVELARGLFPPGRARRLVLVGDALETRGDLESAAREAALDDIVIDAVPIGGDVRPDARVTRLRTSHSRLHEGATLKLYADVESSVTGRGTLRLFENGIEVDTRPVELRTGDQTTVTFLRTPEQRNVYNYLVRLEGFSDDAIIENNEAMALVDVRGRPLLLYIEGEPGEAHHLVDAMAEEGLRLHVRSAESIPETLRDIAGYDGVILSDVPAHKLDDAHMEVFREYVELLGGGFLMIGGVNSFGVGGYYRTPIEEILPVKMKAPDKEERNSIALVLVLDRSGSMKGQKIEIVKSAAIGTAELLNRKDSLGVVAFDSSASWIVTLAPVSSHAAIESRIATLSASGGTYLYPAMSAAREVLAGARARIKHAIVLSDGQTKGANYPELAAQMKSEGITISTVGVGNGAHLALLQSIASAGGGQFYHTTDPRTIPRIFTQDTMTHMKRLIREEAFKPQQVERHPMLEGWNTEAAPALLGYVKTLRKSTSQVPLVTDIGDPLLAHWRYGLGKVTAVTTDCKSRWSSLWIASWPPGYVQFWAQVLREMAREPQGQLMDVRLEEDGKQARVIVDLLEDAAHFKQQADVTADVYFLPVGQLGSNLSERDQLRLDQIGPGRYAATFRTDAPGLYLVRARSGTEMVSAGLVHTVSAEAATGQVNYPLLEKVCKMTGGTVLRSEDDELPDARLGHSRYAELTPWLLMALLALFVADVVIRRWENVVGIVGWVRGR